MAVLLLVLTPQPAFGELIRQSLEQTGQYSVLVGQTANIALSLAQQNKFALAILDSDAGVKSILRVGQTLLTDLPDIKLIAIPPGNLQDRALVDELHPHGYLTKPFYLPDLVESIGKVLSNGRNPAGDTVHAAAPGQPPLGLKAEENDLAEDGDSDGAAADASQKSEPFIPDPAAQLIVAEAWFKESEGKTVPLLDPIRTVPTRLAGDTIPMAIRLQKSATHLEPRSSSLTRPIYASALVPRMPQHYLTGEVADQLGVWVPQFCRAFGWSLEGLKIRPDYMEWIVRIPPTLSPGKMLRVIRERTSQRIFTHFKQINEENLSGNYWAPGFLIISGDHSLPPPVLRKYVTETRQHPGT